MITFGELYLLGAIVMGSYIWAKWHNLFVAILSMIAWPVALGFELEERLR